MSAAQRVLIVGGGMAGLSCAIALRRAGTEAEIVEANPNWTVYGAGLSMVGATLRALSSLDLAERCLERGAGSEDLRFCDHEGNVREVVPLPKLAGPDMPGMGGILRPVLHSILVEAAQAEGTPVKLGVTVDGLEQDAERVEAVLSDGTRESYDLVIGADGAHSRVRELLFGEEVEPVFTGQSVWRALVPRPDDFPGIGMFYGPHSKAGANPVSDSQMYVFLVENTPEPTHPAREERLDLMRERLADFRGPIGWVREQLDDPEVIDHRAIHALSPPDVWHRGRAVLVGDAVHIPTPHMAMGAGLAIEDALVLQDELASHDDLPQALERFTRRRVERCRKVVDSSVQLGEWEKRPDDPTADPAGLSARTWAALAEPI